MKIDPAFISSFMIIVFSMVGWAFTQAQARTRAQRSELRYRRKMQGHQNLREFDLIDQVTKLGATPVAERKEYTESKEEEW